MAVTNRQRDLILVIVLAGFIYAVSCQFENLITNPDFEFKSLNRSQVLHAKALLRWLIDNRTENGTRTFNAGFIRLIFHDCVGGCDGCVDLNDPSNAGLGFYKLPLDLMYRDFIFPMMSRADWYALAGIVAVEYASELTPCTGQICKPDIFFLWGRRDCIDERRVLRFIPGPQGDPRGTIRNTFRMNFAEIAALMGAHVLGKNHARGSTWVKGGTHFNNQYYKDLLDSSKKWKRGTNGTNTAFWTDPHSGHVMLSSDMFMAFEVSNSTICSERPFEACNRTNTFPLVQMLADSNDFWLQEFGTAFNVMISNGWHGRLKEVFVDTLETTFKGELFPAGSKRVSDAVLIPLTKLNISNQNSTLNATTASASITTTPLPTTVAVNTTTAKAAVEIVSSQGSQTEIPTTQRAQNKDPVVVKAEANILLSAQTTTKSPQATTKPEQTTITSAQTTTKLAQTTSASAQTTTKTAQATTKPSQTTAASAQTTTKAAQATTKPSQTTAASAQTTTKAAQATTKPSQTTTKPSPAVLKPIQAVAAPAQTTLKPAATTAAAKAAQPTTKPTETKPTSTTTKNTPTIQAAGTTTTVTTPKPVTPQAGNTIPLPLKLKEAFDRVKNDINVKPAL